jgi:hypothetical protein
MDFAAGIYLSEAQNPIPPPLTYCILVYSILIRTGKKFKPEKRLDGQQFTKLGRKYQHD